MMRLPIFLQLYLLQLENYDLGRFWKGFFRKPIQPRKKIVWTSKAILILVLALIFAVAFSSSFKNFTIGVIVLVAIVWLNFLSAIFLSLAVAILWPLDFLVKLLLVSKAKRKISKFKKLKIIGITGSFGKTTMKESLATVLSQKFRVLSTPENINTPVGIARLILRKLNDATEIFIVEMGAYQIGDIAALCEIAKPDIAILTGINEAHLERFGTIGNTIEAKFEIVINAKPNAFVLLNSESERIRQNFDKYIAGHMLTWYDSQAGQFRSKLLGNYGLGVVNACVIIAKELGLTESEIRAGVEGIKPIPHRLQLIEGGGDVTVIDDSYNGTPDGVREAIRVLGGFVGRRKVYVTPGLVEMGSRKEEVHREIGRQLVKVADLVILIKNSVTHFIGVELRPDQVVWFNSAVEAHSKLKEILKPGDVVMFQNDWPDNYL